MITNERDKELRDLAARRIEAGRPDREAHDLAVKINAGTATPRQRKRFDKLMEKPGTGGGFVPALLASEAEAERVRAHEAEIINARMADGIHKQGRELDATRRERDNAEQEASDVLRANLVLAPGAMPAGPIGDALRALDPDARQIVNLRLSRNARGRLLPFREVAERFRRDGKPGKTYTGERCRQIYRDAMNAHPALAGYADSLTHRKKVALDPDAHPKQWNDHAAAKEIKAMTTDARCDPNDLAGEDAKFRATNHPRRPLDLENSRQ